MRCAFFMILLCLPTFIFALPTMQQVKQHAIITVDMLVAAEKKAEAGDAFSQARLGEGLLIGAIGVLPNYERALYWFNKAEKQGQPIAYFGLAEMYWRGLGVPENITMARKYAKLAFDGINEKLTKKNYIEAELPLLQYSLAELYLWGIEGIVEQDLNKAYQLFLLSANQGFGHAIQAVALMSRYGLGTEVDPQNAFQWSYFLAQLGDKESQYYVGEAYFTGEGVKRDREKGLHWIHEAAKQAYFPAIAKLVDLQRKGLISDISKTRMKSWYNILDNVVQRNPLIVK